MREAADCSGRVTALVSSATVSEVSAVTAKVVAASAAAEAPEAFAVAFVAPGSGCG